MRSMELIESYLDPLLVGDLSGADGCLTQINGRQLAGHMQKETSYLFSLLRRKTIGFKGRGKSKFGFEISVFRSVEFFPYRFNKMTNGFRTNCLMDLGHIHFHQPERRRRGSWYSGWVGGSHLLF